MTSLMRTLFIGHGNPMHAIATNAITDGWRALGRSLPKPAAIACVSAHWTTRGGTRVHVGAAPRTIHDFSGFPDELYAVTYRARGAPESAIAAIDLLAAGGAVEADSEWGLDHGAWSVLVHLFPDADVPVFQISIDLGRSLREHFELAALLKPLRERGVLVVGSGNLVHNLGALAPGRDPYPWAKHFDATITAAIKQRDPEAIVALERVGPLLRLAHPTLEHLLPAIYPLAIIDPADELAFFNESFDLASISMRSFVFG